ncbi:MAG: thiamine-phosphate kinase [Gemmatimonadales bacterium]|nr:MAG: thiamine-phosphate kinase [Gemmatimonadales bacterium]
MTAVKLGSGREFDLIRQILQNGNADPSLLRVGPGDDAAVLSRSGRVVSCDLSVEDVHFRRDWLAPGEVGYRATMAALSDLAAMGAEPLAVLASLAGTAEDAESGVLTEVGLGTRRAALEVGACLAGGDVTRSSGPLVVDVMVVGDTETPVLRSGARPGDEVWVTGVLGGAAGAVRLWKEGVSPGEDLRARFARPTPRFGVMDSLRETGLLTAGMDLSDGLAGDAGHIAAASAVELRLLLSSIPVDPALEEALGVDEAREVALAGGEDYELLVTARPGLHRWVQGIQEAHGVELTRVGTVESGSGVRILDAQGRERDARVGSFEHFQSKQPTSPDFR